MNEGFTLPETNILLMATRNPVINSPVEVGSENPIIFMVSYIPGGCLRFQPSTVAPENGWLQY